MSTHEYLLSAWRFSPIFITCFSLLALFYAVRLRFRFITRSWFFIASMVFLVLALASPVNALAAGYLFSAHMLQHMLLLLVVPLLFLLGLPATDGRKSSLWHIPTLLSWIGGVGAMWVWHQQTLCSFATTTAMGHAVQVVSLLALGILFWRPVFGPQLNQRLVPLAGVIYLFSACIACSILGILITFAPTGAACPIYMHPTGDPAVLSLVRDGWGLSFAKDQQMGGLMMWVPGCGLYLGAVMAMFVRWYQPTELKQPVIDNLMHPEGRYVE